MSEVPLYWVLATQRIWWPCWSNPRFFSQTRAVFLVLVTSHVCSGVRKRVQKYLAHTNTQPPTPNPQSCLHPTPNPQPPTVLEAMVTKVSGLGGSGVTPVTVQ